MPIFVVHEHHATNLHFDFRLEIDGVLKSWAIPKGPSMNPKDKRLAILVDDHALEYADYEGIIPNGQYGAGAVIIWDRGDFEILRGSFKEQKLSIYLRGKILKGEFSLFVIKNNPKQWLFVKKNDEFADENFVIKTFISERKLKTKNPPCKVD
ncbi:MAG: 3'-phosphoesterase [Deltaproteobacteria bacterium]|nr:3'-phosphoesterase [Deltaproteobacteria bacterium]